MPRNKYPEETVQIILDAALKLFAEKGYEETTILDIVSEMGGLTRGAFYHHFKSKEEVLIAVNERMFLSIDPFEKVKSIMELNGLQKIKWILGALQEDKEFIAMQYKVIPLLKSPKFLKEHIESIREYLAPKLCEFIEEGIADGSIKVKNPKLVSEAFFLLTNLWTVPTVFPEVSEEEAQQKVEFIIDICTHMGLPVFDEELTSMIKENYKETE